MKYQYFISSRWRNRDEVLKLSRLLQEKGKTVYCFLEAAHSIERIHRDPEEEMTEYEKRDWRHDPEVKKMFEADMDAERNSEVLILLLPAGKSCHLEAGAAYGMGKKCILIGEQKEAENLYLIFDEVYATIEAFITSLK